MTHVLARGLGALFLLLCALSSVAQNTVSYVSQTTQLITSSTAPITIYSSNAAPLTLTTPPTFTIEGAQDLVVTLTDSKIPAPLASATVIVTQAGALAGSAPMSAGTATVALSGVYGVFTLYVLGEPGTASVGTFSVCVALKATPATCISPGSTAGSITNPTNTNVINTLNIAAADSYTFSFDDMQFPVALTTAPTGTLYQGSVAVATGMTSGTVLSLSPGTYQLVTTAAANSTANAGVYTETVTGALGSQPLSLAIPVGTALDVKQYDNTNEQSVTLTVSDYSFPGPLANASAMLMGGGVDGGIAGGTLVGTTTAAAGAVTGTAPAGYLTLITYGSPGTTSGTFSADVAAGSSDLFTAAQGVGSDAYAFVTSTQLTAGITFQATAADLKYPASLGGLSFAVAQGGSILKSSASAGTVSFTAAAANAVVLVSAVAPASGAVGLFDVNVQSTGSSASLELDQTQSVSSAPLLFNSQSLTINGNESLNAVLTDLQVPATLDNPMFVVSRGSQVLGTAAAGTTLTFNATPGTYQLSAIAANPASQPFGMVGTSVSLTPPSATLTASASSVAAGGTVTLSWTSTYATSCYLQGGSLDTTVEPGGQTQGIDVAISGSQSVTVPSTATYTLTCSGQNDLMANASVTVTATAASTASRSGGGGALDWAYILVSAGIVVVKVSRRNSSARFTLA